MHGASRVPPCCRVRITGLQRRRLSLASKWICLFSWPCCLPSLTLIFFLYVIRVVNPKFQDCLEYYDECIYWHVVRVQAEYVRCVVFSVIVEHLIMKLLQYLLLWDFSLSFGSLYNSEFYNTINIIQYRSFYNTNSIYMLYSKPDYKSLG